jgi:hypothetical protein
MADSIVICEICRNALDLHTSEIGEEEE